MDASNGRFYRVIPGRHIGDGGGGMYSHCLSDGGGGCIATAAATKGFDHGSAKPLAVEIVLSQVG